MKHKIYGIIGDILIITGGIMIGIGLISVIMLWKIK
jgi:hypothetical protein